MADNGLKAITRADVAVIKRFLTAVHETHEGTFDISCTRAAMKDPATMAFCQEVAMHVLVDSILCATMMVRPKSPRA